MLCEVESEIFQWWACDDHSCCHGNRDDTRACDVWMYGSEWATVKWKGVWERKLRWRASHSNSDRWGWLIWTRTLMEPERTTHQKRKTQRQRERVDNERQQKSVGMLQWPCTHLHNGLSKHIINEFRQKTFCRFQKWTSEKPFCE